MRVLIVLVVKVATHTETVLPLFMLFMARVEICTLHWFSEAGRDEQDVS